MSNCGLQTPFLLKGTRAPWKNISKQKWNRNVQGKNTASCDNRKQTSGTIKRTWKST